MIKFLCIAYMAGAGGRAVGLYYFGDGLISGVDSGGMKYEGSYRVNSDGTYEGTLSYTMPAHAASVTGLSVTPDQKLVIPIKLPAEFLKGGVIRIDTPLGPVNAKFELAKELP